MYEIELSVSACLRAATRVDVAWAVSPFAGRDRNEALAITPGGGRIGTLLGGAANDALADLTRRGLVTLTLADWQAQLAGLPTGGPVQCLLVPATDLPTSLWLRLRERDPVCLVAHLADSAITSIDLYDLDTIASAPPAARELFGTGAAGSAVTADEVVTVFWPVPRLVIVGGGPVATALATNAALLGWQVQTALSEGAATGLIAGLAPLDRVVVAAHDLDLAGSALAAALAGEVGYIGALGSRRMRDSRAQWLAYRGITDLDRVHGPAGLDIGAHTPAEIAVSILAEIIRTAASPTQAMS